METQSASPEYQQAEAAYRRHIYERLCSSCNCTIRGDAQHTAWVALGASDAAVLAAYNEEYDRAKAVREAPKPKPQPQQEPAKVAAPTTRVETTKPRNKNVRKAARRVSRSPETWRILSNYPRYEISSHGRVRSLERVRAEDWLKPRRRWFRGMCVDSVVLLDKDGVRRERDIGWLLIAAGFMQRPKWMNQKRGEVSSVE